MIFNKSFGTIEWADIENLITDDQSENENLDYKREVPGRSDGDKKEFLADISSFANHEGGFIVYGIDERIENGQKTGKPSGIVTVTNYQTEVPRLEQIYTTGITPKIPDIEIRAISNQNETSSIVIIKIAKSFAAPHMVSLDQQNKFFIRKQNGKFQMDYMQIRDSFLQLNDLHEKIKVFCNQREEALLNNLSPVPITKPQKLLLHIVPLSTFSQNIVSASQLKQDNYTVKPVYSVGFDERLNIDGLVRFHNGGLESYVQVFWDLTHEFTDCFSVSPFGGHREIFNAEIGKAVCRAVKMAYANLDRLNVGGPKVIFMRLNGMKDIPLTNGGNRSLFGDKPFDRNRVLIPDVLDNENNYLKVTGQLMEKLANAAGYESSPFVLNGQWTGGENEH